MKTFFIENPFPQKESIRATKWLFFFAIVYLIVLSQQIKVNANKK